MKVCQLFRIERANLPKRVSLLIYVVAAVKSPVVPLSCNLKLKSPPRRKAMPHPRDDVISPSMRQREKKKRDGPLQVKTLEKCGP